MIHEREAQSAETESDGEFRELLPDSLSVVTETVVHQNVSRDSTSGGWVSYSYIALSRETPALYGRLREIHLMRRWLKA